MRVLLLALALSACGAHEAAIGDSPDFCGIPPSACGKKLIDEQGRLHTVVCPDANR